MNCPGCGRTLEPITYEGITLESCPGCGGEWLDGDELKHITEIREDKFDEQARKAIAESTTIHGVKLENVDRDLVCPKDGSPTDPINFGGDTGIILDRCTGCGGFWLDAGELEKVQRLVEGWDDKLTGDLAQYGAQLRNVAVDGDRNDDVTVSRIPLVGRFINACVNGILDITT
ncbi:MAG: zf-TFIIB domain-containing protein [Candidatus Hydrogenedentes bacterium]|nr:zf-TFIIB domain-containing protein [Candidatus Hydrogenedentota bacterium]